MKRTMSISVISGLIIEVFVLYFKLEITDIPLFKDLLSATISMGSIAVGFLAAAITLMPSLESNKFLVKLKELGGYKKILNSLLVAIAMLFFLCLTSLVGLFFDIETATNITNTFFYIWVFIFSVSIFSVSVVIWIFLFYLKLSAED